jgi:hypothetical protein
MLYESLGLSWVFPVVTKTGYRKFTAVRSTVALKYSSTLQLSLSVMFYGKTTEYFEDKETMK